MSSPLSFKYGDSLGRHLRVWTRTVWRLSPVLLNIARTQVIQVRLMPGVEEVCEFRSSGRYQKMGIITIMSILRSGNFVKDESAQDK
jgi:hypothetical protein